MKINVVLFFSALSFACNSPLVVTSEINPEPDHDSPAVVAAGPAAAPAPVTVVSCGDSTFSDSDWSVASSTHFNIYYLAGTAAESDLDDIMAKREAAYASIRSALAIGAEPTIDVYMSPSRLAAAAHGVGMGVAHPGADLIEVVYSAAPNSFEKVKYGHELTHVLAYYLDRAGAVRLPILDEGLAEYLDQSGRDMHAAYAQQLVAYFETRTHLAGFDNNDVWGDNYGRAGSLTQMLIDRLGMEAFKSLWLEAAVAWDGRCYRQAAVGCVDTPEALDAFFSRTVRSVSDATWAEVSVEWTAEVEQALRSVSSTLSDGDVQAIAALVEQTDDAINTHDAELYRATMEGFYCDWGGEDLRRSIAWRTVNAFDSASSAVLAIYDTGIKNVPSANAVVVRYENAATVASFSVYCEKYEEGWRIAWGPDWYE